MVVVENTKQYFANIIHGFISFAKRFKESFVANKPKTILATLCWVTYCIFLSTLQVFTSMAGMSKIPVILTIVLAVFVFLYSFFYGKISINYGVISFALFIVYGYILTAFTTHKFDPYMNTLRNLTIMMAVVFLFTINFNSPKRQIACYLLSSIILGTVYAIYYRDSFFNLSQSVERVGAKFGNLNGVGSTFALSNLVLAGYLIKYKRHIVVNLLMMLANCFFILKTGSRTATILTILVFITSLFFLFWKKHKIVLFILLGVIVAIAIIVFTVPLFSTIASRFYQLFELFSRGSSSDSSVNIRISMQKAAYYLWSKNIFFGNGGEAFLVNTNYGAYSHATLSETLCNFGIIGFILFLAPLFIYYIFSRKQTLANIYLFFICFCYLIPEFFGGIIYQHKPFFVLAGFIFGLFNLECAENDPCITLTIRLKKKSFIFTQIIGFLKYEKES